MADKKSSTKKTADKQNKAKTAKASATGSKAKAKPKAASAKAKPTAKAAKSAAKPTPKSPSAKPAKAKPAEPANGASAPSKSKAPAKAVAPKAKSKPERLTRNVMPVAPAPPKPTAPRPQPKGKILSRQFLLELGMAIKEAVQPIARNLRGREIAHMAPSGDPTFEIDAVAERVLLNFLRSARAPLAYYSEDSGYSTFSSAPPKNLLIVDPVDGSRAAKSGFEGCVISIASTRVIERPTIADLDNACVIEILGDRVFYAERGKGVKITEGGTSKKLRLSSNAALESLTWSLTVPARPAELVFPTAARLIDLSSLKGGFFACNSTAYSMTRLLTGQQDAAIDFANRYLRDLGDMVRDQFVNAGRGHVLGITPYDIAAPLLIAQEAGCTITNAYGHDFENVLLLDSSESNHQSLIAAANPELHAKLLSFFDARIEQYGTLLEKKAAARAAAARA